MISKKHKYIFVHIPKNAGTSIRGELKKVTTDKPLHTDWHYTLPQLIEKLGEDHSSYYKFAFSRNPYDRLASAFTYNMLKMAAGDREHWEHYGQSYRILRDFYTGDMVTNFKSFVLSSHFDNVFAGYYPVHFNSQAGFIGDCKPDFLGKVEKIEQGMKQVFKGIGFDTVPKVKRLNVSKNASYVAFYTPEVRERVIQKYEEDFEVFGYKK